MRPVNCNVSIATGASLTHVGTGLNAARTEGRTRPAQPYHGDMREQRSQRATEGTAGRTAGDELDDDTAADLARATAISRFDIARTAGTGVAGAAEQLPHQAAIQRSF